VIRYHNKIKASPPGGTKHTVQRGFRVMGEMGMDMKNTPEQIRFSTARNGNTGSADVKTASRQNNTQRGKDPNRFSL